MEHETFHIAEQFIVMLGEHAVLNILMCDLFGYQFCFVFHFIFNTHFTCLIDILARTRYSYKILLYAIELNGIKSLSCDQDDVFDNNKWLICGWIEDFVGWCGCRCIIS